MAGLIGRQHGDLCAGLLHALRHSVCHGLRIAGAAPVNNSSLHSIRFLSSIWLRPSPQTACSRAACRGGRQTCDMWVFYVHSEVRLL